jgi:hypothetical protein
MGERTLARGRPTMSPKWTKLIYVTCRSPKPVNGRQVNLTDCTGHPLVSDQAATGRNAGQLHCIYPWRYRTRLMIAISLVQTSDMSEV